jgi:Aromatic-ring-opening dioxygenase LigAB, LigA subunit
MGINDVDKTLASNRLIFEVRRDPAKRQRFRGDPEAAMAEYGLSEAERRAWREHDLKRLGELGVHPYFLPQVSRLIEGGAYNHNDSPAARLYAEKLLAG